MSSDADIAVLADIGGTNARFALCSPSGTGPVTRLKVADYPTLRDALAAFLEEAGPSHPPRRAVLSVAGPVEDGRAHVTNSPWTVSAAALAADSGYAEVTLLNDFAVIALATQQVGEKDVAQIGRGRRADAEPVAVLGPGTGLGVGALIPGTDEPVAVASEGGHVTLAPADHRESRVLGVLRDRFGHVSAERVLSGEGLVNLCAALAELEGGEAPSDPKEITERALAQSCPACTAALDMFCAMLGTMAGNLALTFGAKGGVYIAGGIVPRFVDYLAASSFRRRFEAKGRFADYLAAIPTFVVTHPDPAFLGLAAIAARLFHSQAAK